MSIQKLKDLYDMNKIQQLRSSKIAGNIKLQVKNRNAIPNSKYIITRRTEAKWIAFIEGFTKGSFG